MSLHYLVKFRWCTEAGNATDRLRDQRWSSLACGPQTART